MLGLFTSPVIGFNVVADKCMHKYIYMVLWKQIIPPHTILITHHSYSDNKKAEADWQGSGTSANGYL